MGNHAVSSLIRIMGAARSRISRSVCDSEPDDSSFDAFSEENISEYRAYFEKFEDGSGYVTKEQLRAVMLKEFDINERYLDYMLADVDDKFTFSEFVSLIGFYSSTSSFSSSSEDSEPSRYMSSDIYTLVTSSMNGISVTNMDTERMFDAVDSDGDGKITYSEFKKLISFTLDAVLGVLGYGA